MPNIQRSQILMYGDNICKVNGVFDDEVIAIAKNENMKELRKISHAWRANKRSGKIEAISASGISCEQDCFGDECD